MGEKKAFKKFPKKQHIKNDTHLFKRGLRKFMMTAECC